MPLLCRRCPRRHGPLLLESLPDMKRHNKRAHEHQKWECKQCYNVFNSAEELLDHNNGEILEACFCLTCEKNFSGYNAMKSHYKHNHPKKKIACQYCYNCEESMSKLLQHHAECDVKRRYEAGELA